MCRNIKTLFNFEPPATEDEIHASALQFVRKLSGFNAPSKANEAAFELAVAEVSASARKLLTSLHTQAPPRDREAEAEKARERNRARFGKARCILPACRQSGTILSFRDDAALSAAAGAGRNADRSMQPAARWRPRASGLQASIKRFPPTLS